MSKMDLEEITEIQCFVDRCEAAVREMQSDDAARRYQAYLSLETLIEGYEDQQPDNPPLGKFVAFCISCCADYFSGNRAADELIFAARAASGGQ